MDDSYSLKEIIEKRFGDMEKYLEDIKAQTTKTNGRVISLEKSRVQIWTAISILLFVGGAIITLSIMAIDNKINKGIETALADMVFEEQQ